MNVEIKDFSGDVAREVEERLARLEHPNLFNNIRGIQMWIDHRPLRVLIHGDLRWLFAASDADVDLVMPLGECDRETVSEALAHVRSLHPQRPVYVYGLTDRSVEFFDKTLLHEVNPSYALSVVAVLAQENKKLRNAVSKALKSSPRSEPLTPRNVAAAEDVLERWARTVPDAAPTPMRNLLREFPEGSEDYHAAITYAGDRPSGILYLARDAARPEYASVLINIALKEVNGLSELQVLRAAEQAKEWECRFINYGGADPKEDPGLHSYKKKFGWDHIVMEYVIRIPRP